MQIRRRRHQCDVTTHDSSVGWCVQAILEIFGDLKSRLKFLEKVKHLSLAMYENSLLLHFIEPQFVTLLFRI